MNAVRIDTDGIFRQRGAQDIFPAGRLVLGESQLALAYWSNANLDRNDLEDCKSVQQFICEWEYRTGSRYQILDEDIELGATIESAVDWQPFEGCGPEDFRAAGVTDFRDLFVAGRDYLLRQSGITQAAVNQLGDLVIKRFDMQWQDHLLSPEEVAVFCPTLSHINALALGFGPPDNPDLTVADVLETEPAKRETLLYYYGFNPAAEYGNRFALPGVDKLYNYPEEFALRFISAAEA